MSNLITRDGSTMPQTAYQQQSLWKGVPRISACRHHAIIDPSSCTHCRCAYLAHPSYVKSADRVNDVQLADESGAASAPSSRGCGCCSGDGQCAGSTTHTSSSPGDLASPGSFLLSGPDFGRAAFACAEAYQGKSPRHRHALQADATGLKGDIRTGLSTVSAAANTASINVATLAELDLAKSRMEAACSTLQVIRHITLPAADLATRSLHHRHAPLQIRSGSLLLCLQSRSIFGYTAPALARPEGAPC